MYGSLRSALQTVTRSATKHTKRTVAFTKLIIVSTGLVATPFVPIIALPSTAHADASCSPNGTFLAGTDPSWLNGTAVNICNNGSSSTDDYGASCVTVSGGAGGSGCPSGTVYAAEEWQCVELVNRLYLTKGWTTATWSGNGNTLVNNVPSGLTKQNNSSISYVNPGDVITLDDGGFGHAGIINTIDGNGTVHIKNQNTSSSNVDSSAYIDSGSLSGGNAHYHMNGWGTYTVQAIVHAPIPQNSVGKSTSFSPNFDNSRETDLMFMHQASSGGANLYTYNAHNSFTSPGLTTQFLNTSGWNWSQMQVATGDGNGDGLSDLFMLHQTSDGGANLYEFPGGSGSFNITTTPTVNFPGSSWSWSNMKLLIGDFGGTGKSDVMIVSKASDGGANINIYPASNGWSSSNFSEHLLYSDGWNYNYMKFATGDRENDGYSDLFLLFGLSNGAGGANLYELKGGSGNLVPGSPIIQFSTTNGWYYSNMKILTGDFYGDSHGDIMLLYGLADNSANMYIFDNHYSYASPGYVKQLPATSGWNWNNMKVATGDVDNNGISDLTMLHKTSDGGANFYVFYGGSSGFATNSPAAQFPGSSGWNWSEMLGPVWNNMDSPN